MSGKWMPIACFCEKCEKEIELCRMFVNSEGTIMFYGICEVCGWTRKTTSLFWLILRAVQLEQFEGRKDETKKGQD